MTTKSFDEKELDKSIDETAKKADKSIEELAEEIDQKLTKQDKEWRV
jgi:hypothetical protein